MRQIRTRRLTAILAIAGLACVVNARVAHGQRVDRARDRGPGVALSSFGTYIERGQFFFYPFFEYYHDKNAEYKPQELGYTLDQDFRGKYRASEGLVFLAYGISDRLAVELEAAVISAKLEKAPGDPSSMPAQLEESGLGDVEGQLRWRWNRETDSRPEFFSYFETVFPLTKDKPLTGTADWEFKLGTGFVRGFSWGTVTLRAAAEFDAAENKGALGEYAIEYLRRVNSRVRLFTGVEGSDDEVEWISEAQLWLTPRVVLKLNNAIGVTSKAVDWAPEVGVMFRLR